jgi:cytochrome c biogenesis protein CcdA
MNNNKLMQQVTAIFSIIMVFFYLGAGIFLIFYFKQTVVDRVVIVIFGAVLIFYGFYRAFTTYLSIVKLFFRHKDDDE